MWSKELFLMPCLNCSTYSFTITKQVIKNARKENVSGLFRCSPSLEMVSHPLQTVVAQQTVAQDALPLQAIGFLVAHRISRRSIICCRLSFVSEANQRNTCNDAKFGFGIPDCLLVNITRNAFQRFRPDTDAQLLRARTIYRQDRNGG